MTDVFFSIDTAESWKHESGEGAAAVAPVDILDTDRSSGVIDDFEDNDLSEYSADKSSSSATVDASTQPSVVTEGSYALELRDSASSGENVGIFSASGLPKYPQAGDTFRLSIRISNGAEHLAGFQFGLQSVSWGSDGYQIQVLARDINTFRLRDESNTLASTSADISNHVDEWLEIEVEWGEGGSFTCTLYDSGESQMAQISVTDSEYTSGGVGWSLYGEGGGDPMYGDIAKITSITAGTGVIDDFEDGDISEYSGATSEFTTQTTQVKNGSEALQQNVGDETADVIKSSSGLPRYPQRGDTFRYFQRIDAAADSSLNTSKQYGGLYFALANGESDYYLVQFSNPDTGTEVYLFNKVGGSGNTLASDTSLGDLTSEWLDITVTWEDNGDFTVDIVDSGGNNVTTLTANDSAHDGGKIGWRGAATEDNQYWDLAEITSSGDISKKGVVEGFEDGDLSNYSGSGDVGSISAETSDIWNGSVAGNITNTNNGAVALETTESEIPGSFPSPGDTFRYGQKIVSGQFSSIRFGLQNEPSLDEDIHSYRIRIDSENNALKFGYSSSGDAAILATETVTIGKGNFYEIEIDWTTSNDFTVTLHDSNSPGEDNQIAQITASDSTHTDGGIGFGIYDAEGNGESITDYIRLV